MKRSLKDIKMDKQMDLERRLGASNVSIKNDKDDLSDISDIEVLSKYS